MGFRGLTITDDLEMGAIAEDWSVAEGALTSFQAGADILLICKDQGHVRESLDRMQRALTEGSITKERVAQSLKRIKKMKMKFLGRREKTSLADVKEYFKRNA